MVKNTWFKIKYPDIDLTLPPERTGFYLRGKEVLIKKGDYVIDSRSGVFFFSEGEHIKLTEKAVKELDLKSIKMYSYIQGLDWTVFVWYF